MLPTKTDKDRKVPSFEEVMAEKPKIPSYEEVMGVKKKEPSEVVLQEPSDGGLGGTTPKTEPIPTITQEELDNQDDVIGKIQEADSLSKKTRFWGMGGGGGEVPDFDAIAKSKEIHNQLKGMGYGDNDIELLTKTFSDLPKESETRSVMQQDGTVAYPYSKKSFLELYKTNPIAAVTKANNVKNFYELRNAAGETKASEYNKLAYVNDETKPINANIDNFNQLKEKQKQLINSSLPKEKRQEALDRVEENSDIILFNIFQDENNAKNYLIGKLQQKDATLKLANPTVMEAEGKVDGDLGKFSLESIAENLDPKNKAENLAFRKYKYGIDLDNAINSSADLNQAALTFAAEQNPQIKGQLEKLGGATLPNAYEGEIVNEFLNSPDVIQRAESDPIFAEKYNIAKSNLYFNYPDFAKKEVATKISQEMEDRGMTNWFANIPTKEGTDKLVDDLVRTGELTEQDKLVYEKQIRDDLGVWQSVKRGVGRVPFGAFIEESPIQTPGLLESTQNAFNKTIHGVARSVEDVINIPAGGEAFSAKERLYNKLQEDASMVNLIPKSTLHEVSMGTGHLAGFVIPMMAGGAALRGVKGAEFISNGLMFEGENKSNALKLFPDDQTKQYAYTAIATAGDMMLGHLIPKGDAAKGISKTLKGDIVDVVNKFTNKEITAAQAKQTLLNKTTSLLGNLAKENTKVAGTITGFGVFHNTLDALFGANNMGAGDIATQAVKDFKSTFLTTPILAAMAVKGRASGIDGKILMEVASNPELYKKVIAEQSALNPELKATEKERLQNLEDAAIIKKDLDNTEMNDKQKEEFMVTAINKKILERKAAGITDKTLKQSVLDQAEKHDTNLVLLKSEFGDKEFKDLTPEERDRIEPPKDHIVKTQPSGTEGKSTPVIINKKGEHEVLNKSFDTPEAAKVYGEETVKKRYFDENIKNQPEPVELPNLSQPIPELKVDEKGIPIGENVPPEVKGQPEQITQPIGLSVEQKAESQADKISDQKTGDSTHKPETSEAASTTTEGKEGGKKPPPSEPTEPIVEGKGKDKLNDKGVLNHLVSAKNVPEEAKNGFEEKGLKYNTASQKEAEGVAKSIIDQYGVENAVLLADAQKFDGDVNSLIYAEILNRLAKSEEQASTPQEKMSFAKKFAEVGIKYDEAARKGGRFNAAINYFYKKSPLGIQMIENAKRKEAFQEWAKPKEKSWKEFFDEMMKEPEFEAQVKEQVKEGLKKERAEARAARIKKVNEFFDKAKDEFKGGAAYSTIIPPKVIATALEGMKQAYHAGERVAEIVQKAIDYISEQLGGAEWDKEKFRNEWSEKLKDKETKKPLTDEELKAKILDRFRNKLKGLTDKEKEEVVRKSFQKIVESGGLDYADFKKIIADITGRGELTAKETNRLKELVKENNLVDDAAQKARVERTQEARKEYFDAMTKAAKAAKELNNLLYNRPNILKRLTSIMQLNTLGIPALVNNPIYNIVNQIGLRLPVGAIKTGIDKAIELGSGGKVPMETNIVSLKTQSEFFRKLGLGTKESLQQFFTGLDKADYIVKEVQGQQIRPITAWRDLWSFFTGKKNLTGQQAVDKSLQATVGIPAEIVARTLNLGDKPQRFAAEGAQASAFAKALGLKDIDYDLFIDFPKEEAYRAYKSKGLSDAEAAKKADYIKDTIIKEGQRSTFQQDNMLNDVINRAFGREKSGVGSLAKAVTISPYIKIPSNAYWSYYNLVNPEISFLQSMIYGAKAAAKEYGGYKKFLGDKYNTSAAKDLNEAKYWFAHGMVGMATRAVIVSLVGAGVVRPSNTQDDTKKEREGEQNYEQQGTINISKLLAVIKGQDPNKVKNGLNVQMRWFGHWGTLADAIARKNEELTPEQKEKQGEFWDTVLGGMEIDALKDLNQGVFGGTSSLLTAIERNDFQNYGVNLVNMFTNIVQPAALAQIERASMPYYTKQKADTFLGELNNTMLTRSKLYRDLTNQYPPSKIGIWGDRVEKSDNSPMRLFGISRAKPDNFAQPVYEDMKRTNNIAFFPPSVRPEIIDNGEKIKLPVKDASRLEELVGQQRKILISPYINDMATFEGSDETYSELDDDEKLDKLRIIYEEGYENGKAIFLKERPEYVIPEKTPEEKRQDKKESSSNEEFRKALKKKVDIE